MSAPDRYRDAERASIRAFMVKHRGLLDGMIMDFGAGTQPYRDLCNPEAVYVPIEKSDALPRGRGENAVRFDAIMCNQVLQYIERPENLLGYFHRVLKPETGRLVMTYPTNWPEVEIEDLHRFTMAGMDRLLSQAGFVILDHQARACITGEADSHFKLYFGYGVVARTL